MSAQEQQELQYGEVASVKRSHGFIRRCNSALDLFFHFNELDPSSLSPGMPHNTRLTQDRNPSGAGAAVQLANHGLSLGKRNA